MNKYNRLNRYDQKKDGSCTVFASCGAMCNNTGKNLTNEQIRDIAEELGALDGAITRWVAIKIAEKFGCEFEPFDSPDDKIAQEILKKKYELVIVVRATPAFFTDGITDGIVDKEYALGKMRHAMRMKRIDGKDCLVNSWGAVVEK